MGKSFMAAGFLALSMVSAAKGAVIAYDGFDYTAGSSLLGQNGGTGNWTGAWAVHQGNNATIGSLNLSYAGLGTSPGKSIAAGGYKDVTRRFSSTAITTGTFYVSTVMQWSTATQNQYVMRMHKTGTAATDADTSSMAFGIIDSKPVITSGYSTAVATGPTAYSINTPHLLVAKVNLDTKTVSLFVDPISGSPEPAADVSFTFASMTGMGGITPTDLGWGRTTVDELRIGNTFADVTAVPEPAVASVLGLMSISLLTRRRRA